MSQGGNGHRHRPRHGAPSGGPPPGGKRRRKNPESPPREASPAPTAAPVPIPDGAPAGPPDQVLERLRVRVLDAVREIERLREENDALAARLAEMEAGSGSAIQDAFLEGSDPAVLRERIEGFIEALDTYLAQDE